MNSGAATCRRRGPQRRPTARPQAQARSRAHKLTATPRLPRGSPRHAPFRVLKCRSQPAQWAS